MAVASSSWWGSWSKTAASTQPDVKDAVSSTRGDSSASQSTGSSKTPSAEAEMPRPVAIGAGPEPIEAPSLDTSIVYAGAGDSPSTLPSAASNGHPPAGTVAPAAPPPSPMAAPLPPLGQPAIFASLPASLSPQLHVSELMKALIEKQHEVERYFHAHQGAEFSNTALTKMVMMKTELDLLSSSISGILGKVGSTVGQPMQVWPIVDAVPAPYLMEAQLSQNTDHAAAPDGYVYSDPSGQAAPLQEPVYSQEPQSQGPAIFQGFQPPPSYAWARCYPDNGSSAAAEDAAQVAAAAAAPYSPAAEAPEASLPAAESAAAAESLQATAQLSAPRPKSIDMSSPLHSRSQDSSMKVVLAAAMEELHRCQSECSRLRTERRSGPSVEDFEGWCSSIRNQFQAISDRMTLKLETHQEKSRRKDETIKRLYRRLQAAEQASAELFIVPSSSPVQERSPATGARRGLVHDSPMLQAARRGGTTASPPRAGSTAAVGLNSVSPVHLRSPRAPQVADLDADLQGDINIPYGAGLLTWPPTGTTLNRPLPGSDADADMDDSHLMFSTMPTAQSSTYDMAPQQAAAAVRASSSTARELKARRLAEQSSQKRFGANQVQRGTGADPMRREVANLRRRDTDLAVQLRQKEAQVDQLTATLREMQMVNARQIGLYKRQLHLKDNSLQALQEELMIDRGQTAPSTPGSAAGAPTAFAPSAATPPVSMDSVPQSNAAVLPRGTRRQGASGSHPSGGSVTTTAYGAGEGGLSHSASERRTGVSAHSNQRSGQTPRPSDTDRGRGNAPGGTQAAKKEMRDRSWGAQPHSPRPGPRGIMAGNSSSSHTAGEVPNSRRRTMPLGAAGRSTSAEERNRISWRRGEASTTSSQKILRSAPARDSGVPQTARQRR